ncbi:MAG: Hpt domain-containing protein [Candidatus Omnitrophica bacterium]|nr:Hpt domain-containing protein [Candidatus Omnitrophota bacterium]
MSEKALDFEEFMNRVQDDKELFFELLDIFVQDYHTKRKELHEAVEQKNTEMVKQVAHFLKGSCGNISAKPMRAVFVRMEEKVSRGVWDFEQDLKDIDQKFEELVIEIGQLRQRL